MNHLLLLRKQAYDKRGIEKSLHVKVTMARLTACEVGVFSRKIYHNSRKYAHPAFITHGRIF